jgi:hypothetical protein
MESEVWEDGNGIRPFRSHIHQCLIVLHRIFILEGLFPVAVSFVIWKLLPDSPETAHFLTKEEKEFIINRLAVETGSGQGRVTNADRIQPHHVWAGMSSKLHKIGTRICLLITSFHFSIQRMEDLGCSSNVLG